MRSVIPYAGTVCLCLATIAVPQAFAGPAPAQTESVALSGASLMGDPLPADADADGVPDDSDNCTVKANLEQLDADQDGFGNACDADLNNDCVVNFVDLGMLKAVFFDSDENADLTGDGVVNFLDLAVLKSVFFGAPGPSLKPNVCNVTTPASWSDFSWDTAIWQ